MTNTSILLPNLALVLLTFIVWIALYGQRIGEMKAKRISPQKLASARQAAAVLEFTGAADNFRNLFELPVLFYVATLTLFVIARIGPVDLVLAWAFVALRCAHSFIHIGYNRVMHRFMVYVTGGAVLFLLWCRVAWALLAV